MTDDTPKKKKAKPAKTECRKDCDSLMRAKETMSQALEAMTIMSESKGLRQNIASWEFGLVRSTKDANAAVFTRAIEALKQALAELG